MAKLKPRIDVLKALANKVIADSAGDRYSLIQMGIKAWEAGVRREKVQAFRRANRKAWR
jgi:hypothetical protein